MVDPAPGNSADYADALLTARKARSVLILLVLLILFFQLGLFFAARYKIQLDGTSWWLDELKYLVGLSEFLGVVLPIVLAMTLWLIVTIMLLGRVLGVSHLVSAFVASLVLAALLFPWQAFLMNQSFSSDQFRIPGVLYGWAELLLRARVHPEESRIQLLYWARFVGWPMVAIVIVLKIHLDSSKGLAAGFRGAVVKSTAPMVTVRQPPGTIL
jgi:hypothetical protein